MQYNKKDLIQKVIAEATALREHIDPMEVALLNFETLMPARTDLCIYGQMTGDCFSERARYLIEQCATPFSSDLNSFFNVSEEQWKRRQFGTSYYSPIEFYICQPGAKNKALIEFLKGERETLLPKDLKF